MKLFEEGVDVSEEIKAAIARLEAKGWTLAAIADQLEVRRLAVQRWKGGTRSPSNQKAVLLLLAQLEEQAAPKKRRYGTK